MLIEIGKLFIFETHRINMQDIAVALIIKDKKIFLVHSIKHGKLILEFPGGKKDELESHAQCVVREVREELGIVINPIKVFGVYETSSPEGEFKAFIFLSEIVGGEIELLEPENISGFGWYSMEDLIEFNRKGSLASPVASAIVGIKELV
jgi:mutator protein MutT